MTWITIRKALKKPQTHSALGTKADAALAFNRTMILIQNLWGQACCGIQGFSDAGKVMLTMCVLRVT